MTEPYYQDAAVTLYHGDSAEILPTIAADSVDVLLTDPPYFQVKDEEWDRQWKQRDEFLTWLGGILDTATPALKASASVWVFASPLLTSTIEREVVGPRFRVLNSIRWVKEAGWHQKAEIKAQRRYLSPWEGVIFASGPDPVNAYMQAERERAGRAKAEIAALFPSKTGGLTGCVHNWDHGLNLPTREAYETIRAYLGPGYMSRQYDDLVRPFRLNRSGPVTDVWNFPPVMGYAGKHPCEKPLAMLDHMIDVSSKPGAVILDPFAGSGSTLRAAKDAGRRAIGIEKDEKWCEAIANRLCQDVLDFGGAA